MITIRGPNVTTTELSVDVRAELEAFEWTRATWTSDKLIAASPFRYESRPSFAVIFEHGGWRDYGATDSKWASGSFVRLLSFLRRETAEETAEYLAARYNGFATPGDEITLNVPKLTLPARRITRIDDGILDGYRYRSPYLAGRGISEGVQRLMRIGYDKQRRAITIPWFNPDGSLGNVKYRRTDSKTFWYAPGGRPIREMLYGINIAYERRIKRAAIVEAEIDALTLMSAGIFAIATGGTAFTAAKADLLLRSPIEELIIFRDNDSAGRAWRNAIVSAVGDRMDVRLALVDRRYKDINEWRVAEGLRRAAERARRCRRMTFNIRCCRGLAVVQ